jgi:hypothetical protein
MGMIALDTMPQLLTAIGALGTAAFGLVDATKAFGGGVNHIGFKRIKATVAALTPTAQPDILAILQANWFSGADLASQKALAKSLIELNLPPLDARSDLIMTATLDEAYQRADQLYRDGTRAWAMMVSILLALLAGHLLHAPLAASLLAGILATPLAPIAKDLSTAVATAVSTLK